MLASVKNKIISRVEDVTKNGKVYIFLTVSGGYFSSLIFILFIISLSYANSLAYLCSFLFFSIVFVSCHITNYNLFGLDVLKVELDEFYVEEEESKAQVSFKNTGNKTRYDIEASLFKGESEFVLEVEPGKSYEVVAELPKKKPGLYTLKRGNLRTTFPFGIFRSWKPFVCSADYLVIPKPSSFPLPGNGSIIDAEGDRRTSLQREDFVEHRKYSKENLNRIDWKLYAKRGDLFFKEFDSAEMRSYEFDEGLIKLGKKESLERLTYWVLQASREGALFSLKLSHKFIPSGSGKAHLLECLKAIATGGGKA